MSLLSWIPYDISEKEVTRPPFSIFDQNFAVGLYKEDLVHPNSLVAVGLRPGGYYRPWRHHATRHSGTSNIINGKEGFKMSLIPQSWRLNQELNEPEAHTLFDQHFAHGLSHEDLMHPPYDASHYDIHYPLTAGQFGPWRHPTRDITSPGGGVLHIHSDKTGFKVHLDVQHFSLDEISVKIIDNYVVVDCKHDENQDHHGFVSRHFKRRYLLPEGVDPKHVVSTISSGGVLTILAPKDVPETSENERNIPIIQTPALAMTNRPAVK